MSLTDRILSRAFELGFHRAGIAPATPLPHGDAYRAWLDQGYHADMHYMDRWRDIRDQPTALLERAQSIIALAINYNTNEPTSGTGTVASYALGYDYHKVLEHKLDLLRAFIHAETGHDVLTRSAVDRLPILERDVAYLAGIGWYGKNAMIINRHMGSYLFLAELVVDLDLEVNTTLHPQFCGTCTRCLDLCPTHALRAPFVLDSNLCISYLTIEHRGPIPRHLRPLIGDHIFGCDICQDVCPWNRKAPHTQEFAFLGRPDITHLHAPDLLQLTPKTFQTTFALSPLLRPKRTGLLRNAAVVLGNTHNKDFVPLLSQHLHTEPEPLIRGHIAWALGSIGGHQAIQSLEKVDPKTSEYVYEESRFALAMIHNEAPPHRPQHQSTTAHTPDA